MWDWSTLEAPLERWSIKLAVQTTGWVPERGETNVSFPDRETLIAWHWQEVLGIAVKNQLEQKDFRRARSKNRKKQCALGVHLNGRQSLSYWIWNFKLQKECYLKMNFLFLNETDSFLEQNLILALQDCVVREEGIRSENTSEALFWSARLEGDQVALKLRDKSWALPKAYLSFHKEDKRNISPCT